MTTRPAMHTEVECDVCGYDMCERMPEAEAIEAAIATGWRQFTTRLVCDSCLGERACAIFGHIPEWDDYGRHCTRCWEGVR